MSKLLIAAISTYLISDVFRTRKVLYVEGDKSYYSGLNAPLKIRILYDIMKLFGSEIVVEVGYKQPSTENGYAFTWGYTKYNIYSNIEYSKTVSYFGQNDR